MASLDNGSKGFTGYISPAVEDAIKNDQGGTYVLDFMNGGGQYDKIFQDRLKKITGYNASKTQVLTNSAGVFKWVDQT